jgi:hypothetical protein
VSLDFLPQWIIAAGAPAISVIAFFWKGDEALSQDFKQWLTQKILRVKLTVPDISSIEPLGKVFDFIFGRRYFALSTFFRVAAISSIALMLAFFVTTDLTVVLFSIVSKPGLFIAVFILNIIFDYISVTKSRILISLFAGVQYAVIIFLFSDLLLTIGMFVSYLVSAVFYLICTGLKCLYIHLYC